MRGAAFASKPGRIIGPTVAHNPSPMGIGGKIDEE